MYANYQQLIETTTNYTPQIDINTINTFHDYAGIPQSHPPPQQQEIPGNVPGVTYVQSMADPSSSTNTNHSAPLLSMDEEHHSVGLAESDGEFAWSQDWQPENSTESGHAQQQQLNSLPTNPSQSVVVEDPQLLELPSSTDNLGESSPSSHEVPVSIKPAMDHHRKLIIANSVPLSPTIQIHEISSSGVVPTPPPPSVIQHSGPTEVEEVSSKISLPESTEVEAKEVKKEHKIVGRQKEFRPRRNNSPQPQSSTTTSAVDKIGKPEEGLRRRLRCQKENKSVTSSPTISSCKRVRIDAAVAAHSAATLTVTTRSAATTTKPVGCMSTRKSAAAAAALLLRGNGNVRDRSSTNAVTLRSKQASGATSVKTTSSDRLILKCNALAAGATDNRNLLTSSSKFNEQEESQVTAPVVGKRSVGGKFAAGVGSSTGIGRRLSKRDKVRNTTSSWGRGITKSTVQTRNRVQKR